MSFAYKARNDAECDENRRAKLDTTYKKASLSPYEIRWEKAVRRFADEIDKAAEHSL